MGSGDNSRSSFTGQLTLACYACVYLRYIRDGSFMLALFALVIVSLSDFINSLTSAYLRRNQNATGTTSTNEDDTDEVMEVLDNTAIKAILLKGLRYFQIMILAQTLYSSVYHFWSKLDEQFCQHRFGFTTLQLLGELDCDKHGKWFLWFLDVLITLFELILITNSLTPDSQNKLLTMPQLEIHKYGILSILRMDFWSSDLVIDGGPELCIVSKRHAGITNYGSTSIAEQGNERETSADDNRTDNGNSGYAFA